MLTTFGGENTTTFRRIMLGYTGAVVSIFAITMATITIVLGTRQLKRIRNSNTDMNTQSTSDAINNTDNNESINSYSKISPKSKSK